MNKTTVDFKTKLKRPQILTTGENYKSRQLSRFDIGPP